MTKAGNEGTQDTVRILLVEDRPAEAIRISQMLHGCFQERLALRLAPTLASAMDLMGHEQAHIVLLDLDLPDSLGLGTFERWSHAQPGVPTVVLTGTREENLGLEALELGAQDYLVKGDLEPGALERSIRYAIQRQRSVSQIHRTVAELREQIERSEDAEALRRHTTDTQRAILGWF